MDRHARPQKRRLLIWSLILLIPLFFSCARELKISRTEVGSPQPIEALPPVELAETLAENQGLESPVEVEADPKADLLARFNQPNGPNELVKYFAGKLMEGELSVNVKSLRREFLLKGISNAELVEAAQDAVMQNPQISQLLYPALIMGEKSIRYFAYKSTDELESRKLALENKVIELLGEVDLTKMTDYDKSLLVHDLVIKNVEYDYVVYEILKENIAWTEEEWDQMQETSNSYGALVLGKAICGGYAQAYSLLAKAAGLEVYYVEGLVDYNGEEFMHAWNRVKIEDQWLVVDTTWDDTEAPTNYMWFNQPTAVAYTNRQETENYIKTLDDELIGTSEEYTWFYQNDYYATKDTLFTVLTRHIENNEESFHLFVGPLTDEEFLSIQEEFKSQFDIDRNSISYEEPMIHYFSKLPAN